MFSGYGGVYCNEVGVFVCSVIVSGFVLMFVVYLVLFIEPGSVFVHC